MSSYSNMGSIEAQIAKLRAQFKQIKSSFIEGAVAPVEEIGAFCESKAKETIDSVGIVDTGRLKGSVTHYTFFDPSTETYWAVIGTSVFYGVYKEFGTGIYAEGPGGSKATKLPWHYKDDKGNWHTTYGVRPTPWLGPTFRMCQDTFLNFVRDYYGSGDHNTHFKGVSIE